MSKVYETNLDIERERLANEAAKRHKDSSNELGIGAVGAAVALTSAELACTEREFGKLIEEVNKGTVKHPRPWMSWAIASIFGVSGIANLVYAFTDHLKAKKASTDLAALGPQQVVLPDKTSDLPSLPAGSVVDIVYAKTHADRLAKVRESDPVSIIKS